MKHFGLGLVFGLSAGLVLSLFKDENGERLGQPLKKGYDEGVDEAKNLKSSFDKAKDASQRLKENMPAAQAAITGIANDVENYQAHTERTVKDLEHQANKIQEKLDSNSKEAKKD